jgi:hypothetical protein
MTELRSPTRDSCVLLRIHINEAARRRHRVKQTAKLSTFNGVVFVAATAPTVQKKVA